MYWITTTLDTETVSLKPGSFTRVITFISYKWRSICPLGIFLFFFFLCGKNNNRGIIAWLVGLLKHEIERQIVEDSEKK